MKKAPCNRIVLFRVFFCVSRVFYGISSVIPRAVLYSFRMAENGGLGAVEYHEMWHLRQADDLRSAVWEITKEIFPEYIRELCKKAKRRLDSMGITSYNVGKTSRYAEQKYLIGRYDKAEAEIMAKRRKL